MSRIATGTGDQGDTGLFGAGRVAKDHSRVDAYGHVDEFNATLGIAHAAAPAEARAWILRVQRELFVLGADLATPAGGGPRVTAEMVARLDAEIDALESAQPPLRTFILPGGDELSARFHHARTVCRRAERAVVHASRAGESLNPHVLVYLNRLGDLLFLKARERSLATGSEMPMDFAPYR